MITITLPNGAQKQFDAASVTPRQVAEAIGPRLAKDALGALVDGQLVDMSAVITKDSALAIVTPKAGDANALYLIRHSAAHVMAEAICRLWPQTKLAYGPPVDQGFYYDLELDHKLGGDDFAKIEEEVKKILAENRPFTRYELPQDKALAKLQQEGNPYKLDNAQRAIEGDANAVISFYATGEPGTNWEDLCRGPHVPSTGRIGAVKVMSVAGAYWHGDETAQQLQRVYGAAFGSQKELDEHLKQLDEAKARDHRVIGPKLGLFAIDEMVGQGLILWKPKGATLRIELQKFITEHLSRQGYSQVFTPNIGKLDLFKTSGHFPYYQDKQYPPMIDREQLKSLSDEGCTCAQLSNRMTEGNIDGYLLKPMNCPFHIKIYDSEMRSYRDLPIRLAEFGTVYRWEQSGEIGGMTRVRGFTQDDAHLFVTPEQLDAELHGCLDLVKIVFNTLGMTSYRVRVGLRDPDSSKFVGDPALWDQAEAACKRAAESLGVPFTTESGEAAFYGPKIDFVVKDVIGREWQLGTVQVDYQLPIRFDLNYIGADNTKHRPIMIHRAPFGSMERFIGTLIEHFAGAFPTWLSPVQATVLTISEKFDDYANGVFEKLKAAGIRAELDVSGDKIGGKIRRAREAKVPYMLIIGAKEVEQNAVAVRTRKDKDLGALPADAFIERLKTEISTRMLPVE